MVVTCAKDGLFGELPEERAKLVLYSHVLPSCERNEVYLCQDGPYPAYRTMTGSSNYPFVRNTIFHVSAVQKIFREVIQFIPPPADNIGEYEKLKAQVEGRVGQVAHADFIAAMLLRGFTATFAKKGPLSELKCSFSIIRHKI